MPVCSSMFFFFFLRGIPWVDFAWAVGSGSWPKRMHYTTPNNNSRQARQTSHRVGQRELLSEYSAVKEEETERERRPLYISSVGWWWRPRTEGSKRAATQWTHNSFLWLRLWAMMRMSQLIELQPLSVIGWWCHWGETVTDFVQASMLIVRRP